MNEKFQEAILLALAGIEAKRDKLSNRVEKNITDLEEFGVRFDEVVTQLEAERRLDWQNDFN